MLKAHSFRHSTLGEEVASYLGKELLLSENYTPGSFIREEELAKALNVSRAPVREGIKILEGFGLLRTIPQKGAMVVDFSPEEVEELYDIRYALEEIVFREIIEKGLFTRDDYDIFRKKLDRMLLLGMNTDSKETILLEFSKIDMDFHTSLAEKSGRRWTLRMLEMVYRQIQQAVLKDLAAENDMKALVDEHIRILDALLAGDLEELKKGRFFSYFQRRIAPGREDRLASGVRNTCAGKNDFTQGEE